MRPALLENYSSCTKIPFDDLPVVLEKKKESHQILKPYPLPNIKLHFDLLLKIGKPSDPDPEDIGPWSAGDLAAEDVSRPESSLLKTLPPRYGLCSNPSVFDGSQGAPECLSWMYLGTSSFLEPYSLRPNPILCKSPLLEETSDKGKVGIRGCPVMNIPLPRFYFHVFLPLEQHFFPHYDFYASG